jgi:hypothetical protein
MRSGEEWEAKRENGGGRVALGVKTWEGMLTRGLHGGVVGIEDKI